jgi:hypothetical protein
MAKDLQSAVERARMVIYKLIFNYQLYGYIINFKVAAKITGQLHDGPAKRSADSNGNKLIIR